MGSTKQNRTKLVIEIVCRWSLTGSPILGGLIVYGVYRLFFIEANIQDIDVGISATSLRIDETAPAGALKPILGRLSWSVTGTVFVLAFCGAVLALTEVLLKSLRRGTAETRRLILAITALSVVVVGYTSYSTDPFTVLAFGPMLDRTFALLEMSRAEFLLNFFTPMMLAVTVLLMAATWATVAEKTPSGEGAPLHLRNQFRRANRALFAGVTMLVAGVVFAGAMHRLPGVFLDETGAAAWEQMVHGVSASMGAMWSLILLGIYLPTFFVLRRSARGLALESSETTTPKLIDKWLAEHGLATEFPKTLAQIAALLSPLIVGGPAAPLLQLLTG